MLVFFSKGVNKNKRMNQQTKTNNMYGTMRIFLYNPRIRKLLQPPTIYVLEVFQNAPIQNAGLENLEANHPVFPISNLGRWKFPQQGITNHLANRRRRRSGVSEDYEKIEETISVANPNHLS